MKAFLLGGAALASAVPLHVAAQDHSPHQPAAQADPTSAISSSAEGEEPQPVDHSAMDHSVMDHSSMDHGQTDHAGMDHAAMGHGGGQVMMTGMVGQAEASGTARQPQAEGMMPGVHIDLGSDWMGMAHGYLWGTYARQHGPRGDDMAHVQSMAMFTATRQTEDVRLQFRTMLSAEPLMSARGYPNLLATGETADGQPLVDRQHPHDLFMELAARVDVRVSGGLTAFLYGGPVGEPALGPAAFMHRASARMNPEAPITHHWFDSTHITYGVVTAGLGTEAWQIEGSAFRGQEPDEERWGIETPRLDSWSMRATLTPWENWSAQISHARIEQPEAMHAGQDEARTTASIHFNSGRDSTGGSLAAMVAYSAKNRIPGATLTAWLAEANWNLSPRHTLFGRYENANNDELFPDHHDPRHDQPFRVAKLQAGYAYSLPLGTVAQLSLGGSAAAYFTPSALEVDYGRNPWGYTLFARLSLGQ